MTCEDIEGFEFIVEKTEAGGYVARSFGACIITEAEDIEELRIQIRDAVCCHFDDDKNILVQNKKVF